MGLIITPSVPLLQEDLIGNAQGYYPNKLPDFVAGLAPVVNNVRTDLWEGPTLVYVFPTGPMQMQFVSTSANDSGAGTGVQQVHLHYLDNNYNDQSLTVTMNGTTPVLSTPTNILRINGLHAAAVGSGGSAAGDISVQAVGGGVTYGIIKAGYNMARQAIYTVPVGKTGYIKQWQASSGSTGNHFCQVDLRATSHLGILYPGVFLYQDGAGSQNNGVEIHLDTPIRVPATADVKLTALADAANANVTAIGAIRGWYE